MCYRNSYKSKNARRFWVRPGKYTLKTCFELWTGQWASPMEALFWQEARRRDRYFRRLLPGLVKQHYVFGYYLDFAIPVRGIAIEIDGREWHSGERLMMDKIRQKQLEEAGWIVVRFTGSDIYAMPRGCVHYVRSLLG